MSFDHVIFPSIMEDRMWGFYVLLSQDAEQISKPYQVLLSIRNIVLFGAEDFKFQMKIRDRVSFMGFGVAFYLKQKISIFRQKFEIKFHSWGM